jgi:molybdopterin converting factor small subunit
MDCLAADGDDLRAFFIRRYPQLAGLTWQVAVDLELTDGPIQLQAGSEIVLLPPFAGG